MTYNFSIPLKDAKLQDTKQLMSDLLADFLATETGTNARKLWLWVQVLAAGQPLTLDAVDKQTLVLLLESTDRLVVMAKAQMLEVLESKAE